MSSEKRWKRLIFRWTAPKGFVAIALFFTLALLIEYLMVCFFLSSGLTDKFVFTKTLQVPRTSLFFTITISPLFHLIPLGVIAVLVSSWTYLTKYIAVVPRRISPAKKPSEARRKQYPRVRKVRFKSIRRFFKRVGGKFQRVSRSLKAFYRRMSSAVLRIRGVSYLLKRLFFARAAIRSTTTVLAVFVVAVLALYLLGYPGFIHDLFVGFYKANPSFPGFVKEMADAIAQSPVGGLTSAINNALLAIAPGFRSALEGLGTPITEPVAKLDLMWKYAICQNIAAWISAVAALAYGHHTSRLYSRKTR